VIKCTPNGKQTVVAGMAQVHGTSVHQLAYPRGIFVDEENKDIFVADTMNDRIVKWSRNAKEGIIVYNISLPNSLIKDKNNVFYVADRSHRIVRVNSYNQEITTIVGESRNNSHYFSAA
jgi:sugar lactone lactonase YvrE